MGFRVARLTVLALGVVPLIPLSCGGDDRTFVDTDASTGATGGSAGSTGGSAGSSATGGTSGSTSDGGQTCSGNAECEDPNPCNGTETCEGGYCKAGTPLADGTGCTPNVGDAGTGDGGIGEYTCVAGNCALKCTTDAECEDNDVCTGAEICNPNTKTCQSGTPPACEDDDPCTENQCDPTTGCVYPLIDADADGHASTTHGSCGDDCNDNDVTIYSGAAELCDNKDNNCNNQTDELAPNWYPDCDLDGYAPANATPLQQCNPPGTPPTTCSGSGGWTEKAPGAGTSDCWDNDPKAHPMTVKEDSTAWQSVAISGAPTTIDFDYNCDTIEEKRYPKGYVSTSASCTFQCSGTNPPLCGCFGTAGWSSAVPACGQTGTYSSCNLLGCDRIITLSKKQECR